jgi:hypothetical protein
MRLLRLRCGPCGRQVGVLDRFELGYVMPIGDARSVHYGLAGGIGPTLDHALPRHPELVDCGHCRRRLLVDPGPILESARQAELDGRTRTVELDEA